MKIVEGNANPKCKEGDLQLRLDVPLLSLQLEEMDPATEIATFHR